MKWNVPKHKRAYDLHLAYRKRKPFAGLTFFRRTNTSNRFLLVSRHYPWQLCWQWLIEVSFRKPTWRMVSLSIRKPVWWCINRQNCGANGMIGIRFIFIEFTFHKQNYDYMMLDKFYYEEKQAN